MILKLIAVGILTVVSKTDNGAADSDNLIDPSEYPDAERNEKIVFTYHSTKIEDPYIMLEDDTSAETNKFIQEEAYLAEKYFEKADVTGEIRARYEELGNLEEFDGPYRIANQFFSYRKTHADKQDILYAHEEPMGNGTIIFNPNTRDYFIRFQKASSAFSQDGTVFACLTTNINNATNTIRFMNFSRKRYFEERLNYVENIKVAWMKNDGIFYSSRIRVDNDHTFSMGRDYEFKILKLYYHKLGTAQQDDVLLANLWNIQPYQKISFEVTDDANYLIVSVYLHLGSKNLVYVADLKAVNFLITMNLQFIELIPSMEATYEFVANFNSILIFRTNKDAPNSKLVYVDVMTPNVFNDLIPEDNIFVLDWARPAWDKYIVVAYIAPDIKTVLQLFDVQEGSYIKTFELPVGTVKAESFYSDKKDSQIYFKFESLLMPCVIYQFDLNNLSSPHPKEIKRITVPNFNPLDYDVKFVNVPNKRNMVPIPTYIAHKKGIKLNKENLTFLTASGGFGAKLLPQFSIDGVVVLKNLNGVLVVANIRGGGEKGENWHIDGSMHNKQNSMNDFQTVAKYLIDKQYTKPKLLAIYGGNNGISGPLIGASLNQTPDLFGVVIAEAALMDMLKENEWGNARTYEYGSPMVAEDFKYLMGYSPLHNINIENIQYPATMLISYSDDDRVPFFHSLKFIAELQFRAKRSSIQQNPLIFIGRRSAKKELTDAMKIMMFIVMNTEIEFKL